jgi:membrane dipeptidase
MLRALAKKGGVIHINYYSEYLNEDFRLKLAEMGQGGLQDTKSQVDSLLAVHGGNLDKVDLIMAGEPGGRWLEVPAPPPLESAIDHIDHVVKLVGADYVGLGSDWDGISSCPRELDSAAKAGIITRELLIRGYSEEDMKKILGGNTLRVMRRVEAVSDSLRNARS